MLQDLEAGKGGVFVDPENVSAPVVGRQWNVMPILHENTVEHKGLGHPSPVHHFKFQRNQDGRAIVHYRDTDEHEWRTDEIPLLIEPVEVFPVPTLDAPAIFPDAGKMRKLVESMPTAPLWQSSWEPQRDGDSWRETLGVLEKPESGTCLLSWPQVDAEVHFEEQSTNANESDNAFDAQLRIVVERGTIDRPGGNFAVGRRATKRWEREGRLVRAAKKVKAGQQLRASSVKHGLERGEWAWCEMDADTGAAFGHEHGNLYLGQAMDASTNGSVTLRWYRNWDGSQPATTISVAVIWARWMHADRSWTPDSNVSLDTLARDEGGIISFKTLTRVKKLRSVDVARVNAYMDASVDEDSDNVDEIDD